MSVQEGRNLFFVPCCTVGTREVLCVCRKNEVGVPTPIWGLSEACFWRFPNKLSDPLKCQKCKNNPQMLKKKNTPKYPLKPVSVGRVFTGQGLHSAWGNRIPSLDLPASGNCQQSPSELWLSTETFPRLPREGSWGLELLVPSQEALKCHLNSSIASSWFSDLNSPSPQVASIKKKKRAVILKCQEAGVDS